MINNVKERHEKLFVTKVEEATVVSLFADAGEERGREAFDGFATTKAATVIGLYVIANPDTIIKFDAIEYEEPCEEHPEDIWIYVHLNIEE